MRVRATRRRRQKWKGRRRRPILPQDPAVPSLSRPQVATTERSLQATNPTSGASRRCVVHAIILQKGVAPAIRNLQFGHAMKSNLSFIVAAASALGLAACDQVGQDAQKTVEKAGEAVQATAEGASAVAEGAWDATKDVAAGTAAAVDATGEAVKDVAEGTAQDVGAAVDATGAAVQDVTSDAWSATQDVASGVAQDAGAAIDATGSAIQTGVEGAYDATKDTLKAAGSAVEQVGEGVKAVGEDVQQKLE